MCISRNIIINKIVNGFAMFHLRVLFLLFFFFLQTNIISTIYLRALQMKHPQIDASVGDS